MADYWKSIDKKYCDTCKCWITDNATSIQIHENGTRHKIAAQQKLRDIQKKARSNEKDEKKLAKTLRQIEERATAAAAMDKESNPDMSLKIQSYMERLREKEAELNNGEPLSAPTPVEPPKAKILHRDERQQKIDDAYETPKVREYTSRFGGWTSVASPSNHFDLELPTSTTYSVSTGKSKYKKLSEVSPPQINYTAKKTEKKKHVFEEKTLPAAFISTGFQPESSTSNIKSEPGVPEVSFKKRKFSKSNARQRNDD